MGDNGGSKLFCFVGELSNSHSLKSWCKSLLLCREWALVEVRLLQPEHFFWTMHIASGDKCTVRMNTGDKRLLETATTGPELQAADTAAVWEIADQYAAGSSSVLGL